MKITRIIRQVDKYILYYEPLQRMYSVTDEVDVSVTLLSVWFDSYTKDELVNMTDEEFISECEDLLN